MHLLFDRLHASRLLDDVVDELRGRFIPHVSLADPSLGEQVPQVGVKVVRIKAEMTHMPEVQKRRGVSATAHSHKHTL